MEEIGVAIIGAGPAGLAAAQRLAGEGLRTVLWTRASRSRNATGTRRLT